MSAYVKPPGLKRWADDTNPPFPIFLHLDWYRKCRTCSFWPGVRDDVLDEAACANPKSELFGQKTSTEGHCEQWDTYDIEAAVAVYGD